MRRALSFLPMLVLMLGISTSGYTQNASIEVGALAACEDSAVANLTRGKHTRDYAVTLWHMQGLASCAVKVDVVLYPGYGKPAVWAAYGQSARSVHMVPRNMITQGSLLCLKIHGFSVLSDSNAERRVLGGEVVTETCSSGFYDSVVAGRSTGKPGDGFRIVAVVR